MSKLSIIEVVPSTRQPIISATNVLVRANVVTIQNAGNILVILDDGWTLRPGEKISFGNYQANVIIRHTYKVRFSGTSLIPGEDDNPLVEVYEMLVANYHDLADYEDHPNAKA